jgi:hypothetical protein
MAISLDSKQIVSFEELLTPEDEGKREWDGDGVVEVGYVSNKKWKCCFKKIF